MIGLAPDDVMILQPTRIIQRKGIEHAVELVKEPNDPRYKLVISYEAGNVKDSTLTISFKGIGL